MSYIFEEKRMLKTLIEYNNTNIYQHPPVINPNTHAEVIIGDLHSNPIKLLYFLIQQGVLYIKENPEFNYAELARIYTQHGELLDQLKRKISKNEFLFKLNIEPKIQDLLQQQLRDFVSLLRLIEVNDNAPLVRLIGDELADRGYNDYFILKILELLAQKGVDVHINLSNHGERFITYYERSLDLANVIAHRQFASLTTLDYLGYELAIINMEEINGIINQIYKPALSVIDYSLNEDGITLYTHAPVGFFAIKNAAKRLKIPYNDSSRDALAKTIDAINLKFYEGFVKTNKVHELTENPEDIPDTDLSDLGQENKQRIDMAFIYLTWNRWTDAQESAFIRPKHVNGYNVNYVHGHDTFVSVKKHVFNLDTLCGKLSRQEEEKLSEDYPEIKRLLVLESDEISLMDFLKQQAQTQVAAIPDAAAAHPAHDETSDEETEEEGSTNDKDNSHHQIQIVVKSHTPMFFKFSVEVPTSSNPEKIFKF